MLGAVRLEFRSPLACLHAAPFIGFPQQNDLLTKAPVRAQSERATAVLRTRSV